MQIMPFISIPLDSYWKVDLIRHQDWKDCSINSDFMIFLEGQKIMQNYNLLHGDLSWYISPMNFIFVSIDFYCRVDPNRHQDFENRTTDKNFMFMS